MKKILDRVWPVCLGILIIGIIGFVLHFLLTLIIDPLINPEPEPQETGSQLEEKADIYEIHANATEAVRRVLKSPSTAKFPNASKLEIYEYEDDNYQVISYVDSQNSFGATVRSEWMVAMKLTKEHVQIHQILIDGEIVY